MRQADELDVEWRHLKPSAERHFPDRRRLRPAVLAELCLDHAGGERRRENRTFERRPQVDHARRRGLRARASKPSRRDFFRSAMMNRRSGSTTSAPGSELLRERNAQVDHQPGPGVRRTVTVEIDVHADLAETAERHEHEFVGSAFPTLRGGLARSLMQPRRASGPRPAPRRRG